MVVPRSKLQAHVDKWSTTLPRIAPYVFHHTHLENAATILDGGWLYSRNELEERGIVHTDAASQDVIAITNEETKGFVRLYFRPCTPTQWHCEGIRPASGYTSLGAHCPVPVFFVFGFVNLLQRGGTCFSNGNMATGGVEWDDTEELFDRLPFSNIYHRGSKNSAPDPANVVFNRHAEILVPDHLSLAGLEKIVCRSHAERQTLLYKMKPETRAKFENLVVVSLANYFLGEWAYVKSVTTSPDNIEFKIHRPVDSGHALPMAFKYQTLGGSWSWKSDDWKPSELNMGLAKAPKRGVVTLEIAGHVAFQDDVVLSDEPY